MEKIKDRNEALKAIRNFFEQNNLNFFDESLWKDREFMLEAVKNNFWALEYADASLKKDKEVVLEAVKSDDRILDYVDESLKENIINTIVAEISKLK